MGGITLEQLIDIVQMDLTVSGMLPKILPDIEIERIIKEHALEFFYKNYFHALTRMYYYLEYDCFKTDAYTKFKYFILPKEIENVNRIFKVDKANIFKYGLQMPYLSVNIGFSNQPLLTPFLTTIGEIAVYRSIISAFSDEINRMARNYIKFSFNHVDKRIHFLSNVDSDLILDCYVRIEPEELFDYELFKRYVIGLSKIRMGELLSTFTFNLPGGITYNASEISAKGEKMVGDVIEKIKSESTTDWFLMDL